MNTLEKLKKIMQYIGKDIIDTDYNHDALLCIKRRMCMDNVQIPNHLKRDYMRWSIHFFSAHPYYHFENGKLIFHAYNGCDNNQRDQVFVYIEDPLIQESVLQGMINSCTGIAIIKAEDEARKAHLKKIVENRLEDVELGFICSNSDWSRTFEKR